MKLKQIIESGKVVYLEGAVNYSFIHFNDGTKVCIPLCIKAMQERLPGKYIRIHKSYLVNELYLDVIETVAYEVTMHQGMILPVSRRQMKRLKRDKNVTKFIRS